MTTATQPTAEAQGLVAELKASHEFFVRSTSCLDEEHSGFAPQEGMMTVAQLVAHVAHSTEWFVEGAFRAEGFDMDFESHGAAVAKATSLNDARAWVDRAFEAAIEAFGALDGEGLAQPLPAGPVMGGQPRMAVVGGIVEHTAHHRGALTVYSRLQGLVPKMPYGDM